MGYNHASAFLPPTARRSFGLCLDCASKIIAAAGMRFKAENPNYDGDVEVRICKINRVVEIHVMIEEPYFVYYTLESLGFKDAC